MQAECPKMPSEYHKQRVKCRKHRFRNQVVKPRSGSSNVLAVPLESRLVCKLERFACARRQRRADIYAHGKPDCRSASLRSRYVKKGTPSRQTVIFTERSESRSNRRIAWRIVGFAQLDKTKCLYDARVSMIDVCVLSSQSIGAGG